MKMLAENLKNKGLRWWEKIARTTHREDAKERMEALTFASSAKRKFIVNLNRVIEFV